MNPHAEVSRAIDAALAHHGADRDEWMALSALAGAIPDPGAPDVAAETLDRLAAHGWVSRDGDAWALTADGRARRALLADTVVAATGAAAAAARPRPVNRFGGNPHHGFRGAGPRPDADAV
ncbi:hypothetical protein [Microbacterium kunmingense]|uniref:hypothetical protein n=1 Tax=Microbacterium kunmingense TaxID=2915939 RepID=UPI0020059F2E|nr:hypothetical protein [Microbacterium kunmingense]